MPYPDSDEKFLTAFLQSTISEEEFNHEAHLRICWLLLKKHPLLKALQMLTQGLKSLVAKLGAADKYHETLSVALALLMYERMEKEEEFSGWLRKNSDFLTNWRGLLASFYADDLLWSERAKQAFVLGD